MSTEKIEENDELRKLFRELSEVVDSFAGKISTAAALGIIEMLKSDILNDLINED